MHEPAKRSTSWLHASSLLAASIGVGLCTQARAQGADPDHWARRPDAVELHLGAGTPVGYVGLVYDRTLFGPLSGSLGAGAGSARDGASLQLAANARARVLHTVADALYVELGWSTGGYRAFDASVGSFPSHSTMSSETVTYAERAHWLNVLIGGELRDEDGFAGRIYVGLARMLGSRGLRCTDLTLGRQCVVDDAARALPVIGVALGGAM